MSKAIIAVQGHAGSITVELEDKDQPVEEMVHQAKQLIAWLSPNPERDNNTN